MSVDILFDLQQETRRLFIAGSAMASGDLRLAKLLPSLQKLGEAAPVFKRLAAATDDLMKAERESSAEKLLELSTLLSAVLYTQGKTDTPGDSEAKPIQGGHSKLKTDIAYRKLHPLIEALTTKGQGRLEQLRTSFEDGSFLDLRALPAICTALEDSYAEIPDFVQEKLIPAFGPEAVPVLRSQLNLQGGKGDGRRLLLLHRELQDSMVELAVEAATTGSQEVKIAAISILGEYASQEPLLQELSLEKRKEVRTAAYFALASLGTDSALQRLYEASSSKDRELVVEPIRRSQSLELLKRIVDQGEAALERYSKGEGNERNEAAEQIRVVVQSLEGSGERLAAQAYPFLRKLLTTSAYLVQETAMTQEAAAELLLELDFPEADRFAIELGDDDKGTFIRYGFRAAFKQLPKAEVYDRYSERLGSGKSKAAKELLQAIRSLAASQLQEEEELDGRGVIREATWDPRWVGQFIRLDQYELVCLFALRADRDVTDYLTSKLQTARVNDYKGYEILIALFRIRYKEAPELFMAYLEKGTARSLYYMHWQLKRLMLSMPRSYAPRLRAYAEQLTYEPMRNEMVTVIEAVEEKPEDTNEASGRGVWEWLKSKMS